MSKPYRFLCNKVDIDLLLYSDVCVECTETNSKNANGTNEDDHEDDVVNPDAMLSELSVRDFTSWFKSQLDDVIVSNVTDATKKHHQRIKFNEGNSQNSPAGDQRFKTNGRIFEDFSEGS